YLGVLLQPVDKELADALGLDKQEGVLISDVVKDSPAAAAGVEQGDIILQYNDKPAKTVAKLRNDIAMMTPGEIAELKVLRNNKPVTMQVKLGSQTEKEAFSFEAIQKLGIEIENLTPETAAKLGYAADTEAVVITKVKPGSPAAMVGLRPSLLITGVALPSQAQKRIKNTVDFEGALKEVVDKKHLILIVRQQNLQRYYTIKLP
ncbi:MAG: Serine protease, partial [Chlamydiota bacterium]